MIDCAMVVADTQHAHENPSCRGRQHHSETALREGKTVGQTQKAAYIIMLKLLFTHMLCRNGEFLQPDTTCA
jgi:hypothetical protein